MFNRDIKKYLVLQLSALCLINSGFVYAKPLTNDKLGDDNKIVTVDDAIPVYKDDIKKNKKVKVIKNDNSIKIKESNINDEKDEVFSVKISEFLDNAHNKSEDHLIDSKKLSDDRLFNEIYYEFKIGGKSYLEHTNIYENTIKIPGKTYIKNSKTMIPVRLLSEIANCNTEFSKGVIKITNNYNKYALYGKIGTNKLIKSDGTEIQLDNKIESSKGVSYIEISVLEDIWNTKIDEYNSKSDKNLNSKNNRKIYWDNSNKKIRIYPVSK